MGRSQSRILEGIYMWNSFVKYVRLPIGVSNNVEN